MPSLHLLVLTLGPALLLGLLVWAWYRNKNVSDATERRSERGAHDLQEEIDRDQHD